MTATVSGDTMLRLVVVEEGCEVPVYAKAGHLESRRACYEVTCAVALSLAKFKKFRSKIEPMSLGTSDTGGWILSRDAFKKLPRIDGITPELWYNWKGESRPEKRKRERKVNMSGVSNPFVVALYNEASLWSIEEVSYFWILFQRIALSWILKGKLLDIGICKLGMVPYRPHWKELMARKHPNIAEASVCEREFIESGVADSLLSRELIAMDPKEKVISPNLECIPTDVWKKASMAGEKVRLGRLGVVGYGGNVARRIQKAREIARQSLKSWCERARLPFARVSKVGLASGQRIVPDVSSPRTVPEHIKSTTNDIVFAEPKILQAKPPLQELIDQEVDSVLQLQDPRH